MRLFNGELVDEIQFEKILEKFSQDESHTGFFETMACNNSAIPLVEYHLARIKRSTLCLINNNDIEKYFTQDIAKLDLPKSAVIKYYVFAAKSQHSINRLVQIQAPRERPASYWTNGVTVNLTNKRIQNQKINNGSKLCRREFYNSVVNSCEIKYAEILIQSSAGYIIEGVKTNVFFISGKNIITPSLQTAGVAGVMRSYLMQNLYKMGLSVRIENVNLADLDSMDAMFLTNALIGVWPVCEIHQNDVIIKTWNMQDSQLNQIQKYQQKYLHLGSPSA